MNVRRAALTVLLGALAACGGGGSGPASNGNGGERVTPDPAKSALDQAAKSLLLKGLAAGNKHFHDDSYSGFDAAAGAGIDPSIDWLDGTDPEVDQVSIVEAEGTKLHLVTRSESGLYFCLRNLRQFGRGEYVTGYGGAFEDVDEAAECHVT